MASFSQVLVFATSFIILTLAFAFDVKGQSTAGVSYHLTGGEGSLRPEQCGQACSYRCSATSHKKACMQYCTMCCLKCLCVPSGTYGHKEECPCYNNWKTKEGGPKCP